MPRTLTAAVLSEITQTLVYPILIAEVETFNRSTGQIEIIRAWTGFGDLVFSGNTFKGVGEFAGVDQVEEEGGEVKAVSIVFRLSGVPGSLISLALGNEYMNRPAKLWLGFMTAAGALIADPSLVFSGRNSDMAIDNGPETATIILRAESRLADLKRARVRRYTDEDQKQLFPGDKGLEFVAAIQNKEIVWSG